MTQMTHRTYIIDGHKIVRETTTIVQLTNMWDMRVSPKSIPIDYYHDNPWEEIEYEWSSCATRRKKLAKYYENHIYIQIPMLYSLEGGIIIQDANDSIQTLELTYKTRQRNLLCINTSLLK